MPTPPAHTVACSPFSSAWVEPPTSEGFFGAKVHWLPATDSPSTNGESCSERRSNICPAPAALAASCSDLALFTWLLESLELGERARHTELSGDRGDTPSERFLTGDAPRGTLSKVYTPNLASSSSPNLRVKPLTSSALGVSVPGVDRERGIEKAPDPREPEDSGMHVERIDPGSAVPNGAERGIFVNVADVCKDPCVAVGNDANDDIGLI